MKKHVWWVVIAERDECGDARCAMCGVLVCAEVPTNYSQICHECADKRVWHYCDRLTKKDAA